MWGAVCQRIQEDGLVADLFQERIDIARKRFTVEESSCFTGFDAYKKVMELKADGVILTTPPGFRPDEFAAAISAGKHVFMEKPVCVDPVGARSIMATAEKAKGMDVTALDQPNSVRIGLKRAPKSNTMPRSRICREQFLQLISTTRRTRCRFFFSYSHLRKIRCFDLWRECCY
jgi:hypothetical protein